MTIAGLVVGILMMMGGLATMGRRGSTPVAAARGLSTPTRLLFGLVLLLAGFQLTAHSIPTSWGLNIVHLRFPPDKLGWVGGLALAAVLASLAMDRLLPSGHGPDDAED